ncbi:MAG: hypothetical protein EOO95_02275 [Pedobacter sp.]|nr:MAG: hypothetical protein EOO95_02275 [Pedobacter sp.]
MSKIGFILSADKLSCTNKNAQRYVKPASSPYKGWAFRIILRKDEEVKNRQIKGYKYLIP